MVALDSLEDIFEQIAGYSEYSAAALTITTATGFLILTWLTLVFLYHIIQGELGKILFNPNARQLTDLRSTFSSSIILLRSMVVLQDKLLEKIWAMGYRDRSH